jgi:exopolysaccharide production protein ExoQ
MPAPPAQPARPARRSIGAAMSKVAGQSYLPLLVTLLYLLFYANLPDELNGYTYKPFTTAGTIDRTVKIAAIAISLAVIASRWAVVRVLVKNMNFGLVACMLLIPLSAMWSIDRAATLLRYTTLLGLVLLSIAITVAGWESKRFQRLALPPIMFILVASLLYGMTNPDSVKEIGDDISLANSWRGITFQKNQFGMTASFGVILCFHRMIALGKSSVWTVVGLAIAVVCLVLSRSSTSLLATMLACSFMVAAMRVRIVKQRFTTPLVIGIFSLIIIYAAAIQNLIPGMATLLKPVMQLTGKDMTFSARSIIWEIVKEHSRMAPWLGSGYGAYWTGETPSSPSYVFVWVMSFYPTESHNGYLEILNDLGRVGLVCLFAFLVWYVRQGLQLMPFDRPQAVLFLALLYQQMVANLSESEWFSRTTISALLVFAAVSLTRSLLDYRQQQQSPRPVVAGRRR